MKTFRLEITGCSSATQGGQGTNSLWWEGKLAERWTHVIKRGILGIKDSRHWGVLPGTFLKNNGNLH